MKLHRAPDGRRIFRKASRAQALESFGWVFCSFTELGHHRRGRYVGHWGDVLLKRIHLRNSLAGRSQPKRSPNLVSIYARGKPNHSC